MNPDADFARFRRTGDPRALAAVFDATASELQRVAHYLCGDAELACDLVQATFLIAIENRDDFDDGHPVLPWLLGILSNRVRTWRRRERLRARPLPGATVTPDEPVDALIAAELREHCEQAIARLEQPYKQVLELHLVHGLGGSEIARVLERSPDTVRSQIMRGLELLRRLVPAGLAGGVLVAPGAAVDASLVAVRQTVLAHAKASTLVSASVASGVLVGGLAMKKYSLLLGAAIVLVLLGTAFWSFDTDEPAPETVANVEPVAIERTGDQVVIAEPTRDEVVTEQPTEVEGHSLTLRFVWDDTGEPIPHRSVELWSSMTGDRPIHWACTDDTGVCRLDGLEPGKLCYLRPHNRGSRWDMFDVEGTSEYEVREESWAVATGRVLDSAGQPLVGARVYADKLIDFGSYCVETDADGRYRIRLQRH